MSNWPIYTGTSSPHRVDFPPPPPWRRFPPEARVAETFQSSPALVDGVNAALHLRRPLLLTGKAGSGKSSLIESVARELMLGPVIRWHVTSSSTLRGALYQYDAIGRLHAQGLQEPGSVPPSISDFIRLGPLGTALIPSDRPRALLIDEIDKSDMDLPNDLLTIFERGEFEIPELARQQQSTYEVRGDAGPETHPIVNGRVQCEEFPFVVLTSNGERDFPAAFLRRCIRVRMPDPTDEQLAAIIRAHLGEEISKSFSTEIRERIHDYSRRVDNGGALLATDQLMNAIYMITGSAEPDGDERSRLVSLLLKDLTSDAP